MLVHLQHQTGQFLFCCLIDHWRHSYWEASSHQYCRPRSLTGAKGNNVWNLRWIALGFFCLDLPRQGSCLGKYWPFRVSLKWPSNESRKGQLNPCWWEHQKRNGIQLHGPGATSQLTSLSRVGEESEWLGTSRFIVTFLFFHFRPSLFSPALSSLGLALLHYSIT